MAAEYQIPDRNLGRQVRTVVLWALIPIVLVAVPIIWTLVVSLDSNDDTNAIITAQDQADRNLEVQSCTSQYAATYSSWDAEHDRLLSVIIRSAYRDEPPPGDTLDRLVTAGENEAEMNRRRLGLSVLAREEASDRSNGFGCPPIPDRLEIDPVDPTSPDPP